MMSAETELHAALSASTALAALIDTRITPDVIPEGNPLPAVVYQRAGATAVSTIHDGQPIAERGHPHRPVERPEMGVEMIPLGTDEDQPARLVGRDRQRDPQLVEQGREIRGMGAPQRLEVLNRGGDRRRGRGRIGWL